MKNHRQQRPSTVATHKYNKTELLGSKNDTFTPKSNFISLIENF